MKSEKLIERSAALRPLLRQNADRADRDRCLPEETITALIEAGFFRLLTPKQYGGYEVGLDTLLEIVGQLSQGCCSTGWVTLLMDACTWLVGRFPDKAQKEVFATGPDTRSAAVLAPMGTVRAEQNGVIISGQWKWASGILHADWVLLGVPLAHTGDPQAIGLVLVPKAELRIVDTWYMAGMRGTGTNTVVAENVFVPEHRVLPFPDGLPADRGPTHASVLYRHPIAPALITMMMMPYPGMAQAALDYVRDGASTRGIGYSSYQTQRDSIAFQLCLADAATKVETAWLYSQRTARSLHDATERGHTFTATERATFRRNLGTVVALSRDSVNFLVQAHGAAGFAESSPLQRIWRDCNVAATHAVANPMINQETFGRALLNQPPVTSLM